MADTIEYVEGGVRIRVEGLRKTIRDLTKAGADAQDMRDLMHELGGMVVDGASVPSGVTGQLSQTLRAGRGKTKAVVRAGGARAPYAGVIHYGHPTRNIAPQPFLTNALRARRSQIYAALERGIGDLLAKNDLPTS